MKRKLLSVLLITVILVTLFGPTHTAFGHGSWMTLAPRREVLPSRPAPVVDGVCDAVTEYAGAWSLHRILYHPRVEEQPPATMYLLATQTDFYICISGMPQSVIDEKPFVAVQFDVAHDGGALTDSDDLRFTITEDGQTGAYRGNGAGFTPAPDITGWQIARTKWPDSGFAIYWYAEFRIPLSHLGGGSPNTEIGFHVRHNWYHYVGDDYVWPPTAVWNVPNTWADLLWLSAPTNQIRTDRVRITQGLEYDPSGGVAYDLIAGRQTLVRSQLYTLGTVPTVQNAVCQVTALSGTRTTRVLPATPNPARFVINALPYGFFNGVPVFDCWIPGSYLAEAGLYEFALDLTLAGEAEHRLIRLGTHQFQPTRDLRIFLWPQQAPNRPDTPDGRYWGSDLTRAIPAAMAQFWRMHPLRDGVAPIPASGAPGTAGLRYYIYPSIATCMTAWPNCDRTRGMANDAMLRTNALWLRYQTLSGTRREALDWGSLLGASTNTPGGQDCWPGQRVAGQGFDSNPSGFSASILAHEIAHCMGEVSSASPHYSGSDRHSVNSTISTNGLPMINMLTRQSVAKPFTTMFYLVGPAPSTMMEGWEWNDLRDRLVGTGGAKAAPGKAASSSGALFHLIGTINPNDQVQIVYTEQISDLPLELSANFPGSPYDLAFFDAQNNLLGATPFEVAFQVSDGGSQSAALVLTVPWPAGAARVEIRKNGQALYSQVFSQQPPQVSNVVAAPNSNGKINLQWNATDPDSATLTYNVYFKPEAGGLPALVASGLTNRSFNFDTDLAPGTQAGILSVEATDGLNTGQADSNTFAIADKPPVVAILSPVQAAYLVESQPQWLSGSAYDFTAGELAGSALSWSSDVAGSLGSGAQILANLASGWHTLTLTATAPSGLSASASVTVHVRSDPDQDGLATSYENSYVCLSPTLSDSHADPDGDMLASFGEHQYGTNPCEADSDGDGLGDGDEVRLGGDPLDGTYLPLPDKIYLVDDEIDLGTCPSPASVPVSFQALAPGVEWKAAPDSDWIMVSSASGAGDGQFTITANCQATAPGEITGKVLVSAEGGQLQIIQVSITGSYTISIPFVVR
ncbi:MAG: hypothetical protein AB1894_15180 [Chloroflexota bacterium]